MRAATPFLEMLIGLVTLVGLGFLLGRWTAPKPEHTEERKPAELKALANYYAAASVDGLLATKAKPPRDAKGRFVKK